MIKCGTCGDTDPNNFSKAFVERGTAGICKKCKKESDRKRYSEKCEEVKSNVKKYNQENKNQIKKTKAKWREKNREKIRNYMREYRKNGYNKIRMEKEKQRLLNEPEYAILKRLRNRILQALKNNYKTSSTTNLLGCSLEDFKKYFESKFIDGMSWKIFLQTDKIHIDHIRPCASFDLSKEDEQKKCFHYTNLQPLWKEDNLKKGKIYEKR